MLRLPSVCQQLDVVVAGRIHKHVGIPRVQEAIGSLWEPLATWRDIGCVGALLTRKYNRTTRVSEIFLKE